MTHAPSRKAEITIQSTIPKDDQVIILWQWHATHLGENKKIQAPNRDVAIEEMHIYCFNNQGKIAESSALHDPLERIKAPRNHYKFI